MKEYKNFCDKTDERCFSNGKFCLREHLYTKLVEYNTDTSAQLLRNKDEDIVRPILNNEGIELEDKEPLG